MLLSTAMCKEKPEEETLNLGLKRDLKTKMTWWK